MKRQQIFLPFFFATLLIMLLLTTLQGVQSSVQQANGNGQDATVTNISTGPDSLSFTLNVPAVSETAESLDIPGLNSQINKPGSPALPYYATYIALPPDATAELSLQPGKLTTHHNWTVPPVPDPQSAADIQTNDDNFAAVVDSALSAEPDPAVYGKDVDFPNLLYEVSEPMYIRDIRLVQLKLYPLQYNPVSRQLTQYQQLQTNIEFVGGEGVEARPLKGQSPYSQSLDSLILNAEQVEGWRSLPELTRGTGTLLPVGSDAYKIEVNQDGIYEVTYADLQAAGMSVNSVNPNTFQMLYRGQTVAYQFIGDADNQFEAGEKVRFYGWAFKGSRLEKQFINDNVFWLWANGTADIVNSVASQNGFPVASNFISSITTEPETIWYPTWTDNWPSFPNEPDAWYWVRISKGTAAPLTITLNIPLPHPSATGPNANITAEFSSKPNPVVAGQPISHEMTIQVNGHPNVGYREWLGKKNVNVTTNIPMSAVLDGTNNFKIGMHTPAPVSTSAQAVYLNRITADYTRLFIADSDQLIFTDQVGGGREFNIDGYTQNNTSNIIVWDITNPTQPLRVTGVSVTGGGPTYTYEFGTNHPAGATFIATTQNNALSPNQISRYDVPNLEPTGNGADWVAIAYGDFLAETQVLANHRANSLYGQHQTHVVDIEDVVNQYGYGLPIPAAIQNYMIHGLSNWQLPPAYLLLVGDATIDPHMVTWSAPQYLLTDLAFVDRFQGQIPSDHPFSLLVGNDILPDIAVGRITAQTPADASAVVDKIITYDQNQIFPAGWMNNIVFLSDDTDSGGNFCQENQVVADHMPDLFIKNQLCLPNNPTTADADNLRAQLFTHTNVTGTILLNYRGHGSIDTWASGPIILNPSYVNSWNNPSKPVVTITGDCLDGFFAYPTIEGLGEVFLRADNKGTVAHFSSSGLGFSTEHSVLVESMFDAFFLEGITSLGDATNYAKIVFDASSGHPSIMYSFILEGDPAMHLMRPDMSINKTALDTSGSPGDMAEFVLDIANAGAYPAHVVVTDTLPPELNYISFQSSISATATVIGNDVVFNLQFGSDLLNAGLPRNESAVITMTTQVDMSASNGAVTNSAVVDGGSLDTVPGDNSDSVIYNIIVVPIMDFLNFMPAIRKT